MEKEMFFDGTVSVLVVVIVYVTGSRRESVAVPDATDTSRSV